MKKDVIEVFVERPQVGCFYFSGGKRQVAEAIMPGDSVKLYDQGILEHHAAFIMANATLFMRDAK